METQQIAALIMVPLVEEIGWRGYALGRLQVRYGPIIATVFLGAGWAAWHLMMFLFASASPLAFGVSMANILAGAFLFTWLYNRTRGSLLLAVLAHAGAHLNNPGHALPNVVPLANYTMALVFVAAALVLFDRPAWRSAGSPIRS